MNRAFTDRIANVVLYEGYILYPYRPSIKNRQRWTFGGLYPHSYCRDTGGSEAASNQTECLLQGNAGTLIEVVVRFLHLVDRQVRSAPTEDHQFWPAVDALRVGDRTFSSWQEAEEREVVLTGCALADLRQPWAKSFAFDARQWSEAINDGDGATAGVFERQRYALEGTLEISSAPVGDGLFRLNVQVRNDTPLEAPASRDAALMRSLISTHVLLGVEGGEFVSLLEPDDDCRVAAGACRNIGLWPVLIGEEGHRQTMLSSPIILYDYPRIAPESPGDLFDGTEIDEILTLRVLTLTDDEKRQATGIDERARTMLARTETLSPDDLLGMHGTLRGQVPVQEVAHG